MVVHYRIEDKFIHGVTTTHVFAHHPCQGIVIIDDSLLGDKPTRSLLKLALPQQVKLYFFGMDKALEQIRRAEQSDLHYYIIVRNPSAALRLYQQGYRFKGPLTCGQQPMGKDTISIMNGIGLPEAEIEALDSLEAQGVEIVLDPGGAEENIPWKRAKKAVEAIYKKRAKATESGKNTSLHKTLLILDCFLDSDRRGLTLSEIQQQTQIPFSTCHRLADFLEQNGYLVKGKTTKKYSLGWKLLALASGYADIRRDTLFEQLAPVYLRALQEEFGETACIYVRVGTKMKCTVLSPSDQLLQVRPPLGRLWELGPNAISYVLAAPLSQTEQQGLFGKDIQSTDLLQQAARDGYAVSAQGGTEGISAISAAVEGQDGELLGALTLLGPTYRFWDQQKEHKIQRVLEAARALSRDMQQAFLLED